MCISLFPARFYGTLLCLSEAQHPTTGRFVNTLVYENSAQNLLRGGGANAMLLHFPSQGMTRENVVDTRAFREFTKDLVAAVSPRMRGGTTRGLLSFDIAKSVDVFDHDIYSVVLAQNAADIPGALSRVAADKRPAVNQAIFDWYGTDPRFEGWSFALCCFNNRDAQKAAPLMWWYPPMFPNRVMLPGLDAHTGAAPNLNEDVVVDHWVILGSQERKNPRMQYVDYDESGAADNMSRLAQALLPKYVVGQHFDGRMRNGDFVGPVHAFAEGPKALERGLLLAA